MIQRSSLLATTIACIFTVTIASDSALAAENTPIYAAASDYREAVRQFERVVLRTPSIRSSVERLVDDLEDSTSKLKSAARDPARFDRLVNRFVATDALHARVALTFFGDPIFPPGQQLEEFWITVQQTYGNLVYEIRYLQQLRNARRGHPVAIIDHRFDGSANLYAPSPALSAPVFHRSNSAVVVPTFRTSLPTPPGAMLERAGKSPPPTRRVITTSEQLRSAVIGAMLQRK